MRDTLDTLLFPLKVAIGIAIAIWVGLHPLYQALAVLIVADVVTGILASLASGTKLSSDISFRGMAKKALEVLMVAVAAFLEPHAGGLPFGPAVAGYWCAHEGLSVLENYTQAGLPVPQAFRDALEKLNGESSPSSRVIQPIGRDETAFYRESRPPTGGVDK